MYRQPLQCFNWLLLQINREYYCYSVYRQLLLFLICYCYFNFKVGGSTSEAPIGLIRKTSTIWVPKKDKYHGHHSHTCPQHSGSTKDAHEHMLSALKRVVKRVGFTTRRRNVTSSRGGQKGDLQIQNINLAGETHLVIDVALVTRYLGWLLEYNCCADWRQLFLC